MSNFNRDVENENVYLGGDPVQPEDLEADVILPGEEGYQDPEPNTAPDYENEPEPNTDPDSENEPESRGEPEQNKEETNATPEKKEVEEENAEPEPQAEPQIEPEPTKNQMIPKARLDKELRHRRALEAKIRELEQGQQPQPQQVPAQQQEPAQAPEPQTPELDTSALEQAFLEGDMTSFGKSLQDLMASREAQIRESVRNEIQEVKSQVPQEIQKTQAQQDFDTVRDELETQYEFLDPNSDQFDADIVETISGFLPGYVNKGYSAGEALREVADKVLRVERPELFQVKQEPQEPQQPTAKQQEVRQQRMSLDKKLEAAKNQPPAVTGGDVQQQDPLPDFESMSEEDFDKLTEKQLDEYLRKSAASRQ